MSEPLVTIQLPLKHAECLFDIFASECIELEQFYLENPQDPDKDEIESAIEMYNSIYETIELAVNKVGDAQ